VAEIEIIRDATGETRRLGSLIQPEGFVSAYPSIESVGELWDDQQIRRVITASNRVPRRHIFGPSWIQNQKSKGSCNGYALAGGLSKSRYLRGIQDKLLLSGAFPYSLMNGGRDNGSMLSDGLKIIETHGSCPESLVPWDAIYPNLQPANAKAEAAKHKGLVCYAAETMQGLRTGLAKGFIAVVAVHEGHLEDRNHPPRIKHLFLSRGSLSTPPINFHSTKRNHAASIPANTLPSAFFASTSVPDSHLCPLRTNVTTPSPNRFAGCSVASQRAAETLSPIL